MPFAYYNRLNPQQKRIYRESDGVERITLPPAARLEAQVEALEHALAEGRQQGIQQASQGLLNGLTDVLGVASLRVKVLRRRPSWETGELHGLYQAEEDGVHRVSVWMRTAQRAQVVKFKTFLRTLLHELCHHLDYEWLGLEESFHTEGFYKRESSLLRQLVPSRPGNDRVESVPVTRRRRNGIATR
jgi:hypothetical protein